MLREGEIEIKSWMAPTRGAWAQAFAVAAVVLGFMAGAAAGAAETTVPTVLCSGFCAPLSTKQLENTHGTGSDTQVGVILWDELRRQAAPPPPPPTTAGDDNTTVRGPGSIVLVGARSR